MKQIVSRMSSYFPNRWPLSYLNLTKNMKTHVRRQQHKKFIHQDIKQKEPPQKYLNLKSLLVTCQKTYSVTNAITCTSFLLTHFRTSIKMLHSNPQKHLVLLKYSPPKYIMNRIHCVCKRQWLFCRTRQNSP